LYIERYGILSEKNWPAECPVWQHRLILPAQIEIMTTKVLFSVLALSALIACTNNSSTAEADGKKDSASHDDHQHSAPVAAVPDTEMPPADAKVFFKNLTVGQTIPSVYTLQMGVSGMKVDTAGPIVSRSGHHHLIIDGPDSLARGTVVPKDSLNIHFGKGQREYELKLPVGKHKLTLQFADGIHRSYGGQMAATVEVNVKQ
jgi:hypothetical protein